MTLYTDRLILRPWSEDDAEECFKYAKDPRVGPAAGWQPHASVDDSRRVIRDILAVPETYAVVLKKTGLPIGSVGLHHNDLAKNDDEAELGYWLGAPYWGLGLIPEAAREVLRHAFLDLGLARVWCGYYDGNEKSRRVQEKLGFVHQWTTENAPVPQMNETRRGYVNLLKREEWEKHAQRRAVVYVHGMGGSADEANRYRPLFFENDVIGFDYSSLTPWSAKEEFAKYFAALKEKYVSVVLIANSMGAYYSMTAGIGEKIEKAYFISPIVDMEEVIMNMMKSAGISEDELRKKGTVKTENGAELSWEYLCYVRNAPIEWSAPTEIIYGENDVFTAYEKMKSFAASHGASLFVMDGGEHWFHTDGQMRFIDGRIRASEHMRK